MKTINGMEAAVKLSQALKPEPVQVDPKLAPKTKVSGFNPTPESEPQAEWDGPSEADYDPQEAFQDYEAGPAVTLTAELSLGALQAILGGRR